MIELTLPGLEAYAAAHTSEVPELLVELDRETHANTRAPQMLVGRIEGRLLELLVAISGARRVVEVGTFTGYSALCMAAALPDDGELVTCEIDEHHASIARRYFAKSPHGGKIRLRMGPGLDTLRTLPDGGTDLVFVDADKQSYPAYYDEALRILRPGGLLVVDNVLWSGKVLAPADAETAAIHELNEKATRDPRVTHVLLTVRDGMHLVRKR